MLHLDRLLKGDFNPLPPLFPLSLLLQVTFTVFSHCPELWFVPLFGRVCLPRFVFNAFYSLTFTWKTLLRDMLKSPLAYQFTQSVLSVWYVPGRERKLT